MTITSTQFRADYPEFTDTTKFPDPVVNYWIGIAYQMLPEAIWGEQLDLAACLYVAHNVVIEARAMLTSAAGGLPGEATGPKSSKSVDKVSVSYDVGIASEQGAGHWNLTIYGTRLYRLIKLFGAMPIQIGIGAIPSYSGYAWPGPLTTPGFTNFS